ncbi:MAG: hypothetical protein JW720_13600 [Sedimentisphaerales bacterium]|nr:hypothetical protein [Sedimentisphaerales bacterium]
MKWGKRIGLKIWKRIARLFGNRKMEIDAAIDNRNTGLVKNLAMLRNTLDVYCLISANSNAINKSNVSTNFFTFIEMSCHRLIILYICKVFEKENVNQGKVRYELDSIEGLLRHIRNENKNVLDKFGKAAVADFLQKYGDGSGENGVEAISSAVENFKRKHSRALNKFKTVRDKWLAHCESGFNPKYAPSYDIMEKLFNFGLDFYMLVSKAFLSVGQADLNKNRKVKMGFKRMLEELGLKEIRTEIE